MIKYFLLLLVAGISVSCSRKSSSGTTPEPDPPPVPGAIFTVKESQILDPEGKEFIAKGVNVNGPLWPWTQETSPDVNLIADSWKCNIVRINCWPQRTPFQHSANANLPALVKSFTDKKVVVMLEDHSFTGSYPTATELQNSIVWWKALATQYKDNSYVWFNLMNEPGASGSDAPPEWLAVHEAIIKAIRDAGAKNIIVCDEQGYGQANGFDKEASSAALVYGPTLTAKYTNIVFSLHLYDLWIYGKQRLQSYVDALQAKKLALILGEYGTGDDYSMYISAMVMQVTIPEKVSRIAWHWVGQDIHKLTTTGLGGGANIDNLTGAKPGNLSFAGNLVWLDNHGQLTVGDAALNPPSVILSNADFESGNPEAESSSISSWINFGTARLDNTAANVKQGDYSVRVAPGSAGGFGQNFYLEPGGQYRITVWGKNSGTASLPSTVGLKYNIGGVETDLVSLNFSETVYTEKTATFSVPGNIESMFIFIYKNELSQAFWVDDIRIEKL